MKIVEDIILRHRIKRLKILVLPIMMFIGFVIFTFFRGIGHNKYTSTNPAIIRLGFPFWAVLLISLILFIIITVVIKILIISDTENGSKIEVYENKLIVDRREYKMTFNKTKSDKFEIKISRIWGLVYPKFYRIAKIKIKYFGDTYCFLTPVRNIETELLIKNRKV